MRVSINKLTGKLIESQSGGTTPEHLDTLTQNAINAGHLEPDIEVKYATDEEYQAILLVRTQAEADTALLVVELEAIDTEFAQAAYAPVTVTVPEGTFAFKGGTDSAILLDLGLRLAERKAELSVSFIDADDAEVVLSIDSAWIVLEAVGTAFRVPYFKMKTAKALKKK